MKKTGNCENVDCKAPKSGALITYHIHLTRDFDSEECEWCEECLKRDIDMVEQFEK